MQRRNVSDPRVEPNHEWHGKSNLVMTGNTTSRGVIVRLVAATDRRVDDLPVGLRFRPICDKWPSRHEILVLPKLVHERLCRLERILVSWLLVDICSSAGSFGLYFCSASKWCTVTYRLSHQSCERQ